MASWVVVSVVATGVSVAALASLLPDRRTRSVGTRGPLRDPRRRIRFRSRSGDEVTSVADALLFLDLVAVGTLAGVSGPLALRLAADSVGGALSRRLGDALARAALATDPLAELRAGIDAPHEAALREAFDEVHRSDDRGTPLARRLSELSRRHRRRLAIDALTRARTAPVRMLFPLVFLILPAFALMAVVPMVSMTLGSIR